MTTRVVPFMVTNYSDGPVDGAIGVKALDVAELRGDPVGAGLPGEELSIRSFGLIEHRCDRLVSRDGVNPQPRLKIGYGPRETRELALVVDLGEVPDLKEPKAAAFSIEERRSDGTRGGIVVVVASNAETLPLKPIVLAANASPLRLASPAVFSSVDYLPLPNKATAFDRLRRSGFLGVEIVNPSRDALHNVVFYLECLAVPGAVAQSRVFEMSELAPMERFFAAFPLDLWHAQVGRSSALFVTYDDKHDRTRVPVEIDVVQGPIGPRPD
jgi:hypothetical protein